MSRDLFVERFIIPAELGDHQLIDALLLSFFTDLRFQLALRKLVLV